jgi:hypothetical protein
MEKIIYKFRDQIKYIFLKKNDDLSHVGYKIEELPTKNIEELLYNQLAQIL